MPFYALAFLFIILLMPQNPVEKPLLKIGFPVGIEISRGSPRNLELPPLVEAIPKNVPKSISGWIPAWDEQEGLKSFNENPDLFTEISPFWYVVSPDGALQNRPGSENGALLQSARSQGKAIIPTISNEFDGPKISAILNDATRKGQHINAIVNKVISANYEGIDIDYENMLVSDRGVFSQFVQELAAALHSQGKILIVTVHPKTAEPGTWFGPQSQDYSSLGQSADKIRIMAYDYSWAGGNPGPVAPLGWVNQVVAFAISKIPKEKIILGLASYGYDWAIINGKSQGKPLVFDQIIATPGANAIQWDPVSSSPWFQYDAAGVPHVVWFENSQSLEAKIELVNSYNIAGIALWRLGREDKAIYPMLRDKLL